jgi:hypothetical protein
MNDTIGTVVSSPMSAPPQPHWNTATRMPKAAPMLSRLSSTAFSGTTTERKTSTSNRNDSASTAVTKAGRRSVVRRPTSARLAAAPPTCALAGPRPIAPGSTPARSRATVSAVARSCGPVVGNTTSVAIPVARSTRAGATDATPGSAATAPATRSVTRGSPAGSTATTSGPLVPGPKPSATRS